MDLSPELLEVALALDPTNERLLAHKALLEQARREAEGASPR